MARALLKRKTHNIKPIMFTSKKLINTALATTCIASTTIIHAEQLDVEKDELKFGFIKLTDCAPIVIAKEKG